MHLAVVDPGVGGARRAVALRCGERLLVGPDNGLLVARRSRSGSTRWSRSRASPWRLEPVSATFHGRDIFAPVTAHLALGEPLTRRARASTRTTLVRLPALAARPGMVHVVEVDGFGNLITNAGRCRARRAHRAATTVAVGRTFGDVAPGGLVIYEDSAGDVAIAVNGGSAAALLGRVGRRRIWSFMSLGDPREHHETIGSTNDRARELAEQGAAHGTLVTAERADRGPRPPGAHVGDAAGHRDRRVAGAARVRRPAAAAGRARRGRRRRAATRW